MTHDPDGTVATETMAYSVPAMPCAHCVMSGTEEVAEVEGVEDVPVAGVLTSGDPVEAETKTKELLDAVHRFARVR